VERGEVLTLTCLRCREPNNVVLLCHGRSPSLRTTLDCPRPAEDTLDRGSHASRPSPPRKRHRR